MLMSEFAVACFRLLFVWACEILLAMLAITRYTVLGLLEFNAGILNAVHIDGILPRFSHLSFATGDVPQYLRQFVRVADVPSRRRLWSFWPLPPVHQCLHSAEQGSSVPGGLLQVHIRRL